MSSGLVVVRVRIRKPSTQVCLYTLNICRGAFFFVEGCMNDVWRVLLCLSEVGNANELEVAERWSINLSRSEESRTRISSN